MRLRLIPEPFKPARFQTAGKTVPLVACALTIALGLLILPGMQRLTIDNDVQSQLIGESEGERAWRDYNQSFPGESRQLLMMIERRFVSQRDAEALAHLERQLISLPAVSRVYSPVADPRIQWFADDLPYRPDAEKSESSSRRSDGDRRASPEGASPSSAFLERLRPAFESMPTLLSRGRDAALLIVELEARTLDDGTSLYDVVETIRVHAASVLAIDQSAVHAAGLPLIRAELDRRVGTELTRVTLIACAAATLVAFLWLRSLRQLLILLPVPILAVASTLGVMGWLGLPLTILTQAVLILVMVVVFADTLHLMHYVHHPVRSTTPIPSVCRSAFFAVGPACLFTSLTTIAGLLSLLVAGPGLLRDFALAGVAGSVIGLLLVLLALPWMAMWRRSQGTIEDPERAEVASRFRLPRRFDRPVAIASMLLTLALLVNATWLRPGWSLEENLPSDSTFGTALEHIERRFGNTRPAVVELRATDIAVSRGRLASHVAQLENALESGTGHDWLSVLDLARTIPGFGMNLRIASLPAEIREPLWNADDRAALLIAASSEPGAADNSNLTALLKEFMLEEPDFRARRVGLLEAMAHSGLRVSVELGVSLLSTLAALTLLCALMLRSWMLGALALLPSIAPVALMGSILVWLGEPLRQAWVVLFAVCLGLSVDSSVHLLYSWRRALLAGSDTAIAVQQALDEKASVLILATAVAVAGFITLITSSIMTLALAGWLACAALLLALMLTLGALPSLLRILVRN